MEALFDWQNCEIEIRFCFMVGTHKTMEKEWVRWIWESCLSNISDIQTSIITNDDSIQAFVWLSSIQEPISWGIVGGDSWIGNRREWKKQFLSSVTLANSMTFSLTNLAYHSGVLAKVLIPEMRRALALLSFLLGKYFLLGFFSLLEDENWALLTVMIPRFPVEQSSSHLRKASYSTNLLCNSSKVIIVSHACTTTTISLNSGSTPLSVWVMRYWFGMGTPRRFGSSTMSRIVAR